MYGTGSKCLCLCLHMGMEGHDLHPSSSWLVMEVKLTEPIPQTSSYRQSCNKQDVPPDQGSPLIPSFSYLINNFLNLLLCPEFVRSTTNRRFLLLCTIFFFFFLSLLFSHLWRMSVHTFSWQPPPISILFLGNHTLCQDIDAAACTSWVSLLIAILPNVHCCFHVMSVGGCYNRW
jgi:hypothetical protein